MHRWSDFPEIGNTYYFSSCWTLKKNDLNALTTGCPFKALFDLRRRGHL